MSRAGQSIENPVTGERATVVTGTEDTGGQLLIADLTIRPGGAVVGEHIHPAIEERFTVLGGRVGFRLAGVERIARLGETLVAAPGVAHDWRNAGGEEARVRVEIRPAARFEEMLLNLFGLANDGKTDARGRPNLLQLALFGREFQDVIVFTSPPPAVQTALFAVLAPLASLMGYRGSYEKYTSPKLDETGRVRFGAGR